MRPEIAVQHVNLFEKRFGTSHLYLAYHAAFPLALTPDLLYRLWASFQRDIYGRFLSIPWVAVSEVLLSGLCYEVGHELYEMEPEIRSELLKRLKANQNFGQKRILELANVLLEYIQQQLYSDDLDIRDFAKSQQWTVLAYTQPTIAARQIALTFRQLVQDISDPEQMDKPELVRMASLVETFAEPLSEANLEPLVIYAQGMASFARGDLEKATLQLGQVADEGKLEIAGIDVPIPEQVKDNLDELNLPIGPDYSGQNLQGRSFRGQDLTRANFSNTDIRGSDFSHSTLLRANFSGAKTGLQNHWIVGLILCSFLLAILSGVSAATAGWMLGAQFNAGKVSFFTSGIISLIAFLVLYIRPFQKQLEAIEGTVALTIVGVIALASFEILILFTLWTQVAQYGQQLISILALFGGVSIAGILIGLGVRKKYRVLPVAITVGGVGAIFAAVSTLLVGIGQNLPVDAITGTTILSIAMTASGVIALVVAGAWRWTIALGVTITAAITAMFWFSTGTAILEGNWVTAALLAAAEVSLGWAAVVTFAFAIVLMWFDSEKRQLATVWSLVAFAFGSLSLLLIVALGEMGVYPPFRTREDLIMIIAAILVIGSLGIYTGWQALKGRDKFAFIQQLAITLAATGGTTFRDANLTNANFSQALLKGADFRTAILSRTRWSQANKLELACGDRNYPRHFQVQQVLATGSVRDKNFDYMDLEGINLRGANLADASFVGTNLKSADLRGADLSRAKLIATELDNADLSSARLTGAYIQNWLITSSTKLRRVECAYIYTRLPTRDNADSGRQPNNSQRVFKPNEFLEFLSTHQL